MAKTPVRNKSKKRAVTKSSMQKAISGSLPPSGMSARDASIMAPYGRKAMKTPRAPSR